MPNDVPFHIVTRSGSRNNPLTSDEVGQHPLQAAAPLAIPVNFQSCAVKGCHILGEHRYHCPNSNCRITIAHRHNRSVIRGSPSKPDSFCTVLGCHIRGPHRYHCCRVDCQRTEAHRHNYPTHRRRKKLSVPPALASNDQLQDSDKEDVNYTVDPNTETTDDHLEDLNLQDIDSIVGPTINQGPPIYHPQPTHPDSTLLNHNNGIFDDASLSSAYSPGLVPLDPVDDLNEDINFASQQTTFNFNEVEGITYPPIRLPVRESFYPFPETGTYITDYDPSNSAASEHNPFSQVETYITDHDPSNQNEPCTAPTCPLIWPHPSGPYQHNIGLAEEHEVFGRSNPPAELWEALERVEKGEGSENDVAALRGFVEQHA